MNIQLETLQLVNYNDKYHSLLEEFSLLPIKYISKIKDRLLSSMNNKNIFNNAFIVMDKNTPIGYLFIFDKKNDDIYIEYAICKNMRNNGYATRLVNEITNYLCINYNIKSIKLNIDQSNIASIKVAEKCGYELDYDDFENGNYLGKMDFVKDNYNYIDKRRFK